MKKNLRIILAFMALALLGSSCTVIRHQVVPYGTATESYQVEAAAHTPDDWGTFDCGDGNGEQPYYHPNFTASLTESEPGETWVVTVSGDLRSCDTGQGMSTMTVTVDGYVKCDNDTYLLAGTCVVTMDNPRLAELVVTVSWREATQTLLVADIGPEA